MMLSETLVATDASVADRCFEEVKLLVICLAASLIGNLCSRNISCKDFGLVMLYGGTLDIDSLYELL